jgi:hypothetical protein
VIDRRTFLRNVGCAVAVAGSAPLVSSAAKVPSPFAARLPRWRGFNLLEKFVKRRDGNPGFRESDL